MKGFVVLKKEIDNLIQTKIYSIRDVWLVMDTPAMYHFKYPFGM